jgi:hypothetical protein
MVQSALTPADCNLCAEAMVNDSLPVKSFVKSSSADPDSVPLDEPNTVIDMIDDHHASPDGEIGNHLATPHVQDNGEEN